MELIIGTIEWIVNNIVGVACGSVLLVIRVIGTVTPACGFSAEFIDDIKNLIVNGMAFIWPLLAWFPWQITWWLIEAWITYIAFKLMIKWVPRIIVWIVNVIGSIPSVIENLITWLSGL